MKREEALEIILYQCNAPQGFSPKLRNLEFSKNEFDQLYKALEVFLESIRGEQLLERSVAISLYYLEVDFMGAVNHKQDWEEELYEQVVDAHNRCWGLVERILTPEWMYKDSNFPDSGN
jgi:hypothetical protein